MTSGTYFCMSRSMLPRFMPVGMMQLALVQTPLFVVGVVVHQQCRGAPRSGRRRGRPWA